MKKSELIRKYRQEEQEYRLQGIYEWADSARQIADAYERGQLDELAATDENDSTCHLEGWLYDVLSMPTGYYWNEYFDGPIGVTDTSN